MPDRACVSTSSVTKTLLTLSSLMRGYQPLSIGISLPCEPGRSRRGRPLGRGPYRNLIQPDPIVTVVGGHIGEDDFVAYRQAILHLDCVHGAAAERYLHLVGVLAFRLDLEELHGSILLSEYR